MAKKHLLICDADDWTASFSVKNLTDEKYFRSNFPDLFGAQIILPELPVFVKQVVA